MFLACEPYNYLDKRMFRPKIIIKRPKQPIKSKKNPIKYVYNLKIPEEICRFDHDWIFGTPNQPTKSKKNQKKSMFKYIVPQKRKIAKNSYGGYPSKFAWGSQKI
jgi:hypothetical protein